MATPKVKMQIQPADLAGFLNLPADVEIVTIFVTNDPLSFTVILQSDEAFDEIYMNQSGGFFPELSFITVDKSFFMDTPS